MSLLHVPTMKIIRKLLTFKMVKKSDLDLQIQKIIHKMELILDLVEEPNITKIKHGINFVLMVLLKTMQKFFVEETTIIMLLKLKMMSLK